MYRITVNYAGGKVRYYRREESFTRFRTKAGEIHEYNHAERIARHLLTAQALIHSVSISEANPNGQRWHLIDTFQRKR